jgi:hypothetical protein
VLARCRLDGRVAIPGSFRATYYRCLAEDATCRAAPVLNDLGEVKRFLAVFEK